MKIFFIESQVEIELSGQQLEDVVSVSPSSV